jgi:hypothetical protein
MKFFFFILLSIFIVLIYFESCQKSDSSGTTPFSVLLTDAPTTTYDSVVIDLEGVNVIQATSTAATVALNANKGFYNLLNYTNGKTVLIASANLPTTMVLQVQLMLGLNNYVVVGGIRYPLATPAAQQSGLKLNVHAALTAGVQYVITVDFDAAQSIIKTGPSSYSLKPVIRIVNTTTGGSIIGLATPKAALATVAMAINAPDTFSTLTDTSGQFLIKAIPAGVYTVVLAPKQPYLNDTIRNVFVVNDSITNLGTITF